MPAMEESNINTNTGHFDEHQRTLQFAMSMMGLKEAEMEDVKTSKSQNMTECVPVPSSEHVAEIVGRQGCKIKALRAKTNTYIKTPVRGEEPVFVVTGRKEDVGQAQREILSAAEHFTQIRASRRNGGSISTVSTGPPSPTAPGQVTIQVRVPYRVVGLVVGPKGATIKRIQQQTHTYIVTPSREKEPVFEVTGQSENVDQARVEIESHIAMRTGGMADDVSNDFHVNGVDSGFHDIMTSDFNGSVFKVPVNQNAFTSYNNSNNLLSQDFSVFTDTIKGLNNNEASPGMYDSLSSMWSDGSGSAMFPPNNIVRRNSASNAITSPQLINDHAQVTRMQSDPLQGGGLAMFMPPQAPIGSFTPLSASSAEMFSASSVEMFSTSSGDSVASGGSASSSPINGSPSMSGPGMRSRSCAVCLDSDVVAALVPCGHNVFCMECANLLVEKQEPLRLCPVCHGPVTQAIRIIS